MNILFVLGTRPEAIKLAPVILAMRAGSRLRPLICNTEQQKEMSAQALSFFGLRADFRLNAMTPDQSLGGLQARLMAALEPVFAARDIAGTVVQGDTMSAFCGALASFYQQRPVFHVEAGLRTGDLNDPFPEEALRGLIARLAARHFAPTENCRARLMAEGLRLETIAVTGNTVIDALRRLPPDLLAEAAEFFRGSGVRQPTVLITIHRRENHGDRLHGLLAAIEALAAGHPELDWLIPVHPSPRVKAAVTGRLGGLANVFLFPPLAYPRLIYLLINSRLVLSDSGGIQEEAGALGRPIMVLRDKTERVEGLAAGLAELVGAEADRIIARAEAWLSAAACGPTKPEPSDIYGCGRSSRLIVSLIEAYFRPD